MLDVNGVHNVRPPATVEPTSAARPAGEAARLVESADVVEISTAARLAAKIQEIPPVRTGLVQKVKAEIAAGVYETPERIEVAVERLMEDLLPGP
jgi:negative regulator of flagellin synthesis FlgM